MSNLSQKDILRVNPNIVLVGFAGKNGSGKSTIARELHSNLFFMYPETVRAEIWSFASRVKECAKKYFFWDGEKDDKGRHLLQWLGTEVGRFYDENIWIKHLMSAIEESYPGRDLRFFFDNKADEPIIAIIDDVRFDNEAQWIKDNGGYVFQIERECVTQLADHPSELGVASWLITEQLDLNNKFKSPQEVGEYLIENYLKQYITT